MGPRDLSGAVSRGGSPAALAALALLVAAAPAPAAQNLPRNTPWQVRHLQTVRVERTERFLAAWDEAGDEARGRALELLGVERGAAAPDPPGAPVAQGAQGAPGALPGLPQLDVATRVLRAAPGEPPAEGALQRVADGLDLMVVPGLFPAAEEGRGAALTVRVYPLGVERPAPLPGGGAGVLEVALVWIGPDGRELVARTEPFPASAFGTPGFDMYVRAPLSPPATWRLVPELRRGGEVVRGVGVPVAAVAGLEERLARVAERAGGLDVQRKDPFGDLSRLRAHGLRFAHALGPAATLDALEQGWPEDPPAPRRLAGFAPGLEAFGVLAPAGAGAERPVVYAVLAGHGATSAGLFHGRRGEAWRELAGEPGTSVVVLEAARAGPAAVRAALREAGRHGALVAVALGDAASTLHLALAGLPEDGEAEEGLAALRAIVLAAPLEAAGEGLPDVPVLLVTPRPAPPGDRERTKRAAGAPLGLLDEPSLPALLRELRAGL